MMVGGDGGSSQCDDIQMIAEDRSSILPDQVGHSLPHNETDDVSRIPVRDQHVALQSPTEVGDEGKVLLSGEVSARVNGGVFRSWKFIALH